MSELYVETDLYVETAGRTDAPSTLLFMHGPGFDASYFRPYVDELGRDFQLLFYDHRLNGRSARDGAEGVDLATMGLDAGMVATRFGTGKLVVVAHSFGAWVALKLAEQYPLSVHGIVLVAPGLSPTVGHTLRAFIAAHGTEKQEKAIDAAFEGRLSSDEDFGKAFGLIVPLYLSPGTPTSTAEPMLGRIRYSVLGFERFLANGFGRMDWKATLKRSTHPLLVIAGHDDWLETDPTANSSVIASLSPAAQLITLRKCGHFPFVERPAEFCEAIRRWIGQPSST